jgi:hypothetical protein
MLEELIHMLLEEGYEEFTIRSPAQDMAAVHVPTDGIGAQKMHYLSGWCLERKLSITLTPNRNEFLILIKEGQ